MPSNNFTIDSYQVPQWVSDFVYNFGGFVCRPIDSVSGHIETLFIYETSYLESPERWHGLLANNTIGRLVVYNDHPFKFTDQVLSSINALPFADRLGIFCNGFWKDRQKYPNVNSRHMHTCEHWFSHHTMFLLSKKLRQNRHPNKDFMWYTVPKDSYRKAFTDSFARDPVLDNSIVSFVNKSSEMYKDASDRIEHFKRLYGEGEWVNALQTYGNGLPNMKAYEQVRCEIVLETASQGSWHLSEKFFRPMGFGVPIVMLADREIVEQARQYGYGFYDHDNFYNHFHEAREVGDRVQHLRKFMNFIKNNKPTEMQEIADQNYDVFWNRRKNAYYDTSMRYLKELFNKNNYLDDMYDRLDS